MNYKKTSQEPLFFREKEKIILEKEKKLYYNISRSRCEHHITASSSVGRAPDS